MKKREILFRGWNKKNKKWLYGYYFAYRGYHFISPDVLKDLSTPLDEYLVDADTVGQYTGLKDAKGVKIFEGDVIADESYPYIIQYHEEYS
ncbi:YopX family protein [Prevotella amnii]|uniref:YopX family protein n=1 Tax=Prevotella amnii TaxID=419005 RepID=UPI000ADD6A44|nr:YopX family protein [Prevotella amnii]